MIRRFFILFPSVLLGIAGFWAIRNHIFNFGSRPDVVNQATPHPPMGWNSWNRFRCGKEVNETALKQVADAMVRSGMRQAGYGYVIIDDCWQGERDGRGILQPDPVRFPHGMKYMGEYIHSRGLKFGLYTSAGKKTCQGRPGSLGSETADLGTFAAWGVDYLKIDWCGAEGLNVSTYFSVWREAVSRLREPIVLSAVTWFPATFAPVGRQFVNLWRTSADIENSWDSILRILKDNSAYAGNGGEGAWNDPDMLQVGNGVLTEKEARTHFGLWSMMAAPLIAGNDLRQMDNRTQALLTSRDIISIDQDILGIQGKILFTDGPVQVWYKPLANRLSRAVAFFNPSEQTVTVSIPLSRLHLFPPLALFRNSWSMKMDGLTTGTRTVTIGPHDTEIFRIYGLFWQQ